MWPPTYGLKGKRLDATIHAIISDPTLPLALSKPHKPRKTHTTLSSHPAPIRDQNGARDCWHESLRQTMLYTLLAQERYGVPVEDGLLLYAKRGGEGTAGEGRDTWAAPGEERDGVVYHPARGRRRRVWMWRERPFCHRQLETKGFVGGAMRLMRACFTGGWVFRSRCFFLPDLVVWLGGGECG